MAHTHTHPGANGKRLMIAIAIISALLLIELAGAMISGSLALFADAGHAFSDVIGLVVALIATIIAARPATDRATFGYQRGEVFGALVNGLILTIVAIVVSIEAIVRIIHPAGERVQALPMLIVAVIGFIANLAAAAVLRDASKTSINMRGAYLEVLGDLVGTAAVLSGAIVILSTGFQLADAIASLLIAAMILPRAYFLLRDVVRVLSESVPVDTDVAEIRSHILGTAGVVAVHDVHVWAITSGAPVFSAHVVAEAAIFQGGNSGRLLDELSDCLAEHFDVAHSTFQLEPIEHAGHEDQQHA